MPEQEAGTNEVARRGRFRPHIIAAPGSLLAVLMQVSLGAGVSVIPSVVQDVIHLPNVAFCPVAGEPILSEVAAVFRSGENSPTVKNFIQQVQASPEFLLQRADWDRLQPNTNLPKESPIHGFR